MTLKFNTIFSILLVFTTLSFSQNDWKTFEKDDYSISYPKDWDLDTSGQMNTKFLLFSKTDKNDTFRENVNLIIQDLKGKNMEMKDFVQLTEHQIKTMVPNSKLISSKTVDNYHILVWKGQVANNDLKFKQYFFLINENVYILTFTTLQNTFDKFITIGNEILNSFKFK